MVSREDLPIDEDSNNCIRQAVHSSVGQIVKSIPIWLSRYSASFCLANIFKSNVSSRTIIQCDNYKVAISDVFLAKKVPPGLSITDPLLIAVEGLLSVDLAIDHVLVYTDLIAHVEHVGMQVTCVSHHMLQSFLYYRILSLLKLLLLPKKH